MNAELKIEMAGYFKMVVSSEARGSRVVAEFKNLILDNGLNRMGAGPCITACQVGTNSTPPSNVQTGLSGYLAGTTNIISSPAAYVAGPPAYMKTVWQFRFGAGVAAGNLTEVGVGWAAATGNLFSRALILDGGGSPTTVTILPDESLDVYYELRVYPPTADVVGSITIAGVSYDYIIRAANTSSINSWYLYGLNDSGGLGATISSYFGGSMVYTGPISALPTDVPGGIQFDSFSSGSAAPYSAGSFRRDFTYTAGLTSSNHAGGIRSILVRIHTQGGPSTGFASFQVQFSATSGGATIPKDATKVLSFTFRFSWARRP